ncbi:hypothetical protein ASO20_02820 [Mycoplasma sp. (ex Biomphalaria glabrata)]|uniref:hypothetical protein n=1 Tax=Mycoplasma sp. (ex Biomphalaria glabrata) TaxID=1749074 RepID=UPI00073ABEA5|nr:hypothetical protein [Mycoplasma sp. (ex Biomphalaria glabrata)]ALV23566.1 hypothetical protein ASO20_02820 [Mycoplasma sp. (ex Biomphalaria glabrata)]
MLKNNTNIIIKTTNANKRYKCSKVVVHESSSKNGNYLYSFDIKRVSKRPLSEIEKLIKSVERSLMNEFEN